MNSAAKNSNSDFSDLDAIWKCGSFEEAEAKAESLLHSDPLNHGAKIIMARALTSRHQFNEAECLFNEAMADPLLLSEAALDLFDCFLLQEKYDHAREISFKLVEQFEDAKYLATYFRLPAEARSTQSDDIIYSRLLLLLSQRPKSAELHLLLSRFYLLIGNNEKAANSYLHAVGCPDGGEGLLKGYGTFLYELGKLNQSARVFRELTRLEANESYHWIALAGIYFQLGSYEEAEEVLLRALDLEPDNVAARINLGLMQSQLRRHREACQNLEIALSNRSHDEIKSDGFWLKQALQLAYFKKHLADWDDSPEEFIEALQSASQEELCAIQMPPFHLMTLHDSPELQQRVAAAYKSPPNHVVERLGHAPMDGRKLRVGWFGSDFHDHATMYLLMGVFREYDSQNFEFSLFSYGYPREEEHRAMAISSVDNFYELGGKDDQEVIEFAKSQKLDIAIDLKGYTAGGRSHIFASRLAPIQIFYLGYPGSSGKEYFDYLVADNTVVDSELRKYCSESLMYLPHSYQPNDPLRKFTPSNVTKEDFGLPADSFVFCSFNQTYKISPDEFAIWMDLLHEVENSVLWLLCSNEADDVLRAKATDHGIEAERIVFGESLSVDDHLARLSVADVFLDSFKVNGHTSVSDALFAGVPVVTLPGSQFAARVGASLVKAAGCDYLIAESRQDYKDKAIRLATEPSFLSGVKSHLRENLIDSPLYDSRQYTRNLENLFSQAVALSGSGEAPRDISVK